MIADDRPDPDLAEPEAPEPPSIDGALRLLRPDRRRDARLKGRGEEPGFTPFIAIDHDDPVAPTGVFYLSPDLWVVSSQGMNLPVEGEENQIFARVHNRGLSDAVSVTVRFYWADPSAAITDASANPIGGSLAGATVGGLFIPAAAGPGLDSSVVVPCPVPWFPDTVAHACLLVKAWAPGADPSSPPFEPVLEPAGDRHSAQHNVTVRLVPPGSAFKLEIEVANIGGFTQSLRLLVQALDFKQAAGRLMALGVPLKDEPRPSKRGFPLDVRLGDARGFLHRGHGALGRLLIAEEARAAGRGTERGAGRAAGSDKVTLADIVTEPFAPWERRQLSLGMEVPDWAEPGEVFGFEVTQFLGEIATGGYVALVVVGRR